MKELKEVDYNPICPHCGKEIEQLCLHPRRGSTLLRKEAPLAGISALSCPHCRKLIGASTLAFHQKKVD